jgi:hypothetical protein
MKEVHVNCYNVVNRECSKNAHKKLGLDFSQTEKCVNESFSGSDWGSLRTKNYIIDEEISYMKDYGTYFYPAIVINNRTYRGQIESLAVFNALCAGFENPPALCQATLGSYQPDFLDEDYGI